MTSRPPHLTDHATSRSPSTDHPLPTQSYCISISNEQSLMPVDESWLMDVVRGVLVDEGIAESDISLAIVDDDTIRVLNSQFLDHDYATDVLSFRLDDSDALPADANLHAERTIEGEVVISAETALRTAAELALPGSAELALYLVHGLLHLCGHDDQMPEALAQMRDREVHHLKKWGIQPHYPE